LKLTEWLELSEAGMKVFEVTDWNKKRVAATGQGSTRTLACCQEILKKKKRSLSRHASVIAFFKSSSRTRALPPLLLDLAHDDPDGQLTVQAEVPALSIVFCLSVTFSVEVSQGRIYLVLIKIHSVKPRSPF
jgi:hypothetical protein